MKGVYTGYLIFSVNLTNKYFLDVFLIIIESGNVRGGREIHRERLLETDLIRGKENIKKGTKRSRELEVEGNNAPSKNQENRKHLYKFVQASYR